MFRWWRSRSLMRGGRCGVIADRKARGKVVLSRQVSEPC